MQAVLADERARATSVSGVSRRRARLAWLPLVCLAVGIGLPLAAGYAGWLGRLETCGADGARVCVAWPGPVAFGVWFGFVVLVAALGVWHARTDWSWRALSINRAEVAWLLALMCVALAERVWRADLAQVGYDESSAASLIAAWRFQGLFPLTGIVSSVGIPNPPAWPYLLALGVLPFNSPDAVVGLGVATSMLGIVLTWWVARRWVGRWAALAALMFYAGGFWATVLGRTGWQPVFLQVPMIMCLDALLVLAVRRRPWALTIACGWLAVMVQLHYVAAVFAALVPLAAWPARRELRPRHVAACVVLAAFLLSPFLIYELNPDVRFRDLAFFLAQTGSGAHVDLEAWDLLWTLAANRGAAGLGGADSGALREALGRWSQVGLVGVPLVAFGMLGAVAGWPRGWRGWLIAAWVLVPAVGLARHAQGVLFHYLYLGLPGMALAVGALAEWSVLRAARQPRWAHAAVPWVVGGALAAYVTVSAGMLWVVLDHVDRSGAYPAQSKPLGLNLAAAAAARAARPPDGTVLIGGQQFEVEVLRFSVGYDVPSRIFDDCSDVPVPDESVIYLLNSEHTLAASALTAGGAPLLARVQRPGDASLIFGPPPRSVAVNGRLTDAASSGASEACASRSRPG